MTTTHAAFAPRASKTPLAVAAAGILFALLYGASLSVIFLVTVKRS